MDLTAGESHAYVCTLYYQANILIAFHPILLSKTVPTLPVVSQSRSRNNCSTAGAETLSLNFQLSLQ